MIEKLSGILTEPGIKTLFVGIGNVLRSDDGVGVYLVRQLERTATCDSLLVEVSIENYIGKINSLRPDKLVLVDCVDFGREPGYHDLHPVSELMGVTTNTHNISLANIGELFHMPTLILGIQPASLSFGEKLSGQVKAAADGLARRINACLLDNRDEAAKEIA